MESLSTLFSAGLFLLTFNVCIPFVQAQGADNYKAESEQLILELMDQGISSEKVLTAMREVPRHKFVPDHLQEYSYRNHPLPIGQGQTISQPYIVAFMTQELSPSKTDRVLEIGTGSGYQAAVLAKLVDEVYSIEIVDELAQKAKSTLKENGYNNVHVKSGDGYGGWPKHAPFDRIIITAAPPEVPSPLIEQLAIGGKLLAPVGTGNQNLVLYEKTESGIVERTLIPVLFVPMTGRALEKSIE